MNRSERKSMRQSIGWLRRSASVNSGAMGMAQHLCDQRRMTRRDRLDTEDVIWLEGRCRIMCTVRDLSRFGPGLALDEAVSRREFDLTFDRVTPLLLRSPSSGSACWSIARPSSAKASGSSPGSNLPTSGRTPPSRISTPRRPAVSTRRCSSSSPPANGSPGDRTS